MNNTFSVYHYYICFIDLFYDQMGEVGPYANPPLGHLTR